MGETRVDLQHLLEDLRDAYTGALEETILTEAIANALDSRATRIQLVTNATEASLTIVDDGRGMQRRELARFHDVAASTKTRGEGIGFAGVGIKLGLLVSREVITETRRGVTHARGDEMASRITPSCALEVDSAAWPEHGTRYGGQADSVQPAIAAARHGLRRGRSPAALRAAAGSRLRRTVEAALPERRDIRSGWARAAI